MRIWKGAVLKINQNDPKGFKISGFHSCGVKPSCWSVKKRSAVFSKPCFHSASWKKTDVFAPAARKDSLFWPDFHFPDRFSSERVQGKPLLWASKKRFPLFFHSSFFRQCRTIRRRHLRRILRDLLHAKISIYRKSNLRFLPLHLVQNSSTSEPPHLCGIAFVVPPLIMRLSYSVWYP